MNFSVKLKNKNWNFNCLYQCMSQDDPYKWAHSLTVFLIKTLYPSWAHYTRQNKQKSDQILPTILTVPFDFTSEFDSYTKTNIEKLILFHDFPTTMIQSSAHTISFKSDFYIYSETTKSNELVTTLMFKNSRNDLE